MVTHNNQPQDSLITISRIHLTQNTNKLVKVGWKKQFGRSKKYRSWSNVEDLKYPE